MSFCNSSFVEYLADFLNTSWSENVFKTFKFDAKLILRVPLQQPYIVSTLCETFSSTKRRGCKKEKVIS